MHIEELARKMREEALAKESDWFRKVEEMKKERAELEKKIEEERRQKTEQMKRLYFNAGRWAGGARDKKAKEAFEVVRLIG